MELAETRDQIREFYSSSDVSDDYVNQRFGNPIGRVMHERQVRFINDVIRKKKVRSILEIASGPARISVDLTGFEKGVMVEVNQGMLELARKRLEAKGCLGVWRLIHGDAFTFTTEEHFDLVYSFRFIRHFKADARRQLYALARNSLKDGGFLIFDAPNVAVESMIRSKWKDIEKVYDELYTKDRVVQELDENGFKVVCFVGVWAHYLAIQRWIQIFLGPRCPRIAYYLIRLFEHDSARNPVEWIVLCQKK